MPLGRARPGISGKRQWGLKPLRRTKCRASAPWWESALCLGLVVFATALPLLYPPIPPLVDLLGHMGRYRVELDLGHSPWLQHYYDYHWAAIGNLGVDLLVIPLGKLHGARARGEADRLDDPATDRRRLFLGGA